MVFKGKGSWIMVNKAIMMSQLWITIYNAMHNSGLIVLKHI